ncbi:uncharacterized protein PITG_04777 [Phytophthora infestans T30-4]|uniref:Uncharacterized protein n=2 Tax=Phytophthora infestans (strain T30-4) TaxID=403677 RepID=D0N209_PHYIT|nr:uncharacterized protein PITG_04777 [Phytophthora infestans T30-4]EEY68338.1 conserved hypothetical protein [Phytophthora infestans T30-4]|eukprot:XP_002905497.1 conserved hypothetical protein [Phytophthora infestans T30-4]
MTRSKGEMRRRQRKLYEQRQHPDKQALQYQVRKETEAQWMTKRQKSSRVASWWSYDVEGEGTELHSTSLSTSCDQHDRQMGLMNDEKLMPDQDGYPFSGTKSCLAATESWKTLWLGKTCNRALTVITEESSSREHVGGIGYVSEVSGYMASVDVASGDRTNAILYPEPTRGSCEPIRSDQRSQHEPDVQRKSDVKTESGETSRFASESSTRLNLPSRFAQSSTEAK